MVRFYSLPIILPMKVEEKEKISTENAIKRMISLYPFGPFLFVGNSETLDKMSRSRRLYTDAVGLRILKPSVLEYHHRLLSSFNLVTGYTL